MVNINGSGQPQSFYTISAGGKGTTGLPVFSFYASFYTISALCVILHDFRIKRYSVILHDFRIMHYSVILHDFRRWKGDNGPRPTDWEANSNLINIAAGAFKASGNQLCRFVLVTSAGMCMCVFV